VEERSSSSARARVALILALILVGAFALRCAALGHDSLWIDEIQATSFAKDGNVFTEVRDRGGPLEPPLSHVATRAALTLPFDFETSARLPAAIAGTLEVLALYLLALEATRRRAVGLLAAALLAVAPFAVRYSQEVRYFTLFSAIQLFAWWLLLRALRGRTRDWWWLGAAWGAALLTAPYAVWVVAVQGAVALVVLARRSAETRSAAGRGIVHAAILGALISLPWYVWGFNTWRGDHPDYYRFAESRARDISPGPAFFKRSAEWLLGNEGRVTLLSAVLVLAVLAAPFAGRGALRLTAIALAAYLLASTAFIAMSEWLAGSYFAFRRVEWFVPLLVLAVAITVVGIADRLPHSTVWMVGSGVVLVGLGLVATLRYYDTTKTPWRAAAEQTRDADSNTTVVIGPVDAGWVNRIDRYLAWRGVDRDVQYIVSDRSSGNVAPTEGSVLWITGAAPPAGGGLTTVALAPEGDLQVIAGDASWGLGGQVILPLHASRSQVASAQQFLEQLRLVSQASPILPAP